MFNKAALAGTWSRMVELLSMGSIINRTFASAKSKALKEKARAKMGEIQGDLRQRRENKKVQWRLP
jgi:hypothetical protein